MTDMTITSGLVAFGIPMLVTIPATAIFCRCRIACKKRVSFGTIFVGASCFPLLLAVIDTCIEPGIWWSRSNHFEFLIALGIFVAICILPASGVVLYYQRRSNRDEKPVV
jgi:hypothetical protein